jgi:Mn2+/Fe2+ NRAMP family transporter
MIAAGQVAEAIAGVARVRLLSNARETSLAPRRRRTVARVSLSTPPGSGHAEMSSTN